MNKLYLLSFGAQKDLIDKYCFKKCGHILFGAVIFMDGNFGCCKNAKCKYKEKQLEMGKTEIRGEEEYIVIRKLKQAKRGKG